MRICRTCGRARGSKALVPLASLSRALLKRNVECLLLIAIGESDIAFYVRYISFHGWVQEALLLYWGLAYSSCNVLSVLDWPFLALTPVTGWSKESI